MRQGASVGEMVVHHRNLGSKYNIQEDTSGASGSLVYNFNDDSIAKIENENGTMKQ